VKRELVETSPPSPSDPWSYVQPWDLEAFGPDLLDEEQRRRWARAVFLAGGLPYMWQTLARPIRDIIYGLLELRAGDRVFIVGEGNKPCGWSDDMRNIVGTEGAVDDIEIIRDGRAAVMQGRVGRNGKIGCWKWTYSENIPDESYDCVAIMQSTQHCDKWEETGPELLRIMKPGRRIVFAEMVLGGPRFMDRIHGDVHINQWYDKMFPKGRETISNYTGEEINAAFGHHLAGPQAMEWHGIEMFWGRKPKVKQ
jgi:SAM-dependent methyltransferase